MLFSERSLWTMLHGIGLGGGALLALMAVLSALYLARPGRQSLDSSEDPSTAIAVATTFAAMMVWLTTLVGTYVVFPSYRAAPPEGTTDLARYPRAMLLTEPTNAWLHSFAMETKEHLPLVAGMLATAVAFVAWRYRRCFLDDRHVRRLGATFLAVCFGIVAYVSLLGVFVNKVAPLE